MILLRITCHQEQQAEEIATDLLKARLALDINFKRNIERWERKGEELVKRNVVLITAKTKSILFPVIDDILKNKYSEDDMPEIYSLAIVNMDWEQSVHLSEEVRGVK